MDSYKVGSVADFISQKKKTKPKIRNTKNESVENKQCQQEPEKKFCGTEKLNKRLYLETITGKKNSQNDFENNAKKRKRSLKDEVELIPKQRKLTEGVSSLKTSEDLIELPELEYQPSDSSEDESTSKKSTLSRKNKKIKSKDDTENTIFVGNLPTNYDKQKVCKVFSKFGKIQSARIRCVPIADYNMSKKVAAVKKKFNPQRNSLVAYVKYVSNDSVKAAIEANGMVIDGHHLRIDSAEENKQRDNNKAVFVGGLPFNIEDDELWEFFKNCGKIDSVRIIRDSHTTMGKGFGYVNFNSTASVELALQLDGQELKKRTINVKRCTGKKVKQRNKINQTDKKKIKGKESLIPKKEKRKKLKAEKKGKKSNHSEKKSISNDFQGRKANMKQKKKKKLSKEAVHKRKIIKILGKA